MATKKQKRERGQQKHQAFMADVRESGLKAQARDREYRARKAKRRAEEAQAENDRLEGILKKAKKNQEE